MAGYGRQPGRGGGSAGGRPPSGRRRLNGILDLRIPVAFDDAFDAGFDARGWSAAIEDLRAAAAWLKSKGVPDSRIAFGGASIGANLISIAATERASVPFLLLLSPSVDYRGVKLTARKGLKILAAASPADGYTYAGVKEFEATKAAAALYAPEMFEDPATFERIVAWATAAAAAPR